MKVYTPYQSLSKAYRNKPIQSSDFSVFKDALDELYKNAIYGQAEQTQRKFFTTFLETILPKDHLVSNEENGIDLPIHVGNSSSGIGVLIEIKKMTNKDEMVTKDDINRRAIHQLLYYFLKQRKNNNENIKYLVISNINELFIWDALLFEKKLYQNKPLIKEYEDFEIEKEAGRKK